MYERISYSSLVILLRLSLRSIVSGSLKTGYPKNTCRRSNIVSKLENLLIPLADGLVDISSGNHYTLTDIIYHLCASSIS